ncbi:diguanylate cyclase [Salinimonas sp. HHU 13199]|uniref:diguanylate cyclase n=1 Tax=Salinimonas profundi TaxID=2729140 RepID=A0ABR8LD90_9ALTE|nr:diguanylate cyclase [Salinimonas profundi]MBD3584275.1 diguanylate cyclase [Salinimonas profundi]
MAVLHARAKVLIVDDDIATIRLIADALSADYDVLVAKTAREGLTRALESQPDLILLDVVMPGADGFALCRQLKSYDQIQQIPVIFVSALDAVAQQTKGFELGAVDYITKPVEIPILRARVRTHTRLYKQTLQLASLAATDPLTNLANRRKFEEAMAREIERNHREQHALSLLITDIDNFKAYNDRYGHGRGDDCLIEVARLLCECARRGTDLVSRLGGEEFGIILSDTDILGAEAIAQKIGKRIAAANITHEDSHTGRLSVSTGVVTVDFAALAAGLPDSRMLVDCADSALYDAKAQGRDSVVINSWP